MGHAALPVVQGLEESGRAQTELQAAEAVSRGGAATASRAVQAGADVSGSGADGVKI